MQASHSLADKFEVIFNKTKRVMRQFYGYTDDEYFFLKIFDLSNSLTESIRNSTKFVIVAYSNLSMNICIFRYV